MAMAAMGARRWARVGRQQQRLGTGARRRWYAGGAAGKVVGRGVPAVGVAGGWIWM